MTGRAVVLARGLGRRMRCPAPSASLSPTQLTAADQGQKAMMPVGRPLLDYALATLADAGVREACVVIGPDHHAVRHRYTQELPLHRIGVAFAVQERPLGTADALLAAEPFTGANSFLLVNGDNVYPAAALRALAALDDSGLVGYQRDALLAEGNFSSERIAAFALLEVSPAGVLQRIVEKPDPATLAAMGPRAPVSMNSWRFGPAIFEACRRVVPSPRGELELQDAVSIAMHDLGVTFQVVSFAGGVLDLSTRDDIALVQRRLAGREVRL